MKRIIYRITSLLVLIAMILGSFSGCGLIFGREKSYLKKLTGTYYVGGFTVDSTSYINDEYTLEFKEEYKYAYCDFIFDSEKNTFQVVKTYDGRVIANGTCEPIYYNSRDGKGEYDGQLVLDNGDEFLFDYTRCYGGWESLKLYSGNLELTCSRGALRPESWYFEKTFSTVEDMAAFLYDEENYLKAYEEYTLLPYSSYSDDFMELYRKFVYEGRNLIYPTVFLENNYYVCFDSYFWFGKPFIEYAIDSVSATSNNDEQHCFYVIYLDEELSEFDAELSELLSEQEYVYRQEKNHRFSEQEYGYFIYEDEENADKALILVHTSTGAPIDRTMVENLEFQKISKEDIIKD